MKIYKTILKSLFAMIALLASSASDLAAQSCQVQYSGSLCVGIPITFTGELAGSTHDFDFNGENSTTGPRIVNYAFKTSGTKTITYITTLPSGKCTSTLQLVIKESPKINFKLTSPFEQCFEKNLFCFRDSSYNPNGAQIVSVKVIVSDGQFLPYSAPTLKMPHDVCFSIKDQRGGLFDLYIEIEDANGCVTADTIQGAVKVREAIGARFSRTSPKNPGCDSVVINVNNISRISSSQIAKAIWSWGDGDSTIGWGPNYTHTYRKPGTYDAKLILVTIDGCKDSFEFKSTATVFSANARIIADKDSACLADGTFTFNVVPSPIPGGNPVQWLWGPPPYILGVNRKLGGWGQSFSGGIGPWQVSFTYNHAVCGNRVIYDTVLILGPQSTIEIPFNRLLQHQVFQCPKNIMDSVQTKNFSTFYHTDANFNDDNGTFKKADGTLGHKFDNTQKPIDWVPQNKRDRWCATRLWDFGDNYAPRCTTDVALNKNKNVNCNWNRDSLPSHYYGSWNLLTFSNDFKNSPMQSAIFVTSTGLCKKLNVWPSDSFYVFDDSILYVPLDPADIADTFNYPGVKIKNMLREKYVYGPGERYIQDYYDIDMKTGDSLYVGPMQGPWVLKVGPQILKVQPKDVVKLKSKTDTMRILFTLYIKRDTLAKPLFQYKQSVGHNPILVSKFQRTPSGVAGFDYVLDYNLWRQLFFATVPRCPNLRLKHVDTCHPLKCEHEATKQLVLMHASAGGIGSSLTKQAQLCLGTKSPANGITFILSDLKPGCSYSDLWINFDSATNPNAFVPLSGLSPGNRPPGPPFPGYQLAGNPPSRYSKTYTASEIADKKTGCITVGIIVGNGVDPLGNRPLCKDTQWYSKFACFPILDPIFKLHGLVQKPGFVPKICKYDPFWAYPSYKNDKNKTTLTDTNLTQVKDLRFLRWEFATGNASPYYSLGFSQYVQEEYFHAKYLRNDNVKEIPKADYDTSILNPAKKDLLSFVVINDKNCKPIQTKYYRNYAKEDTVGIDAVSYQSLLANTTLNHASRLWSKVVPNPDTSSSAPKTITKYFYIPDSSILYNYVTVQRFAVKPAQQPCTNNWYNAPDKANNYVNEYWGVGKYTNKNGKFTTLDSIKMDTVITAVIPKWEVLADVTEVWEQIRERAQDKGFNPFSLTQAQIAQMIWNNIGVIGQPSTGAYGCLDTCGFGKLIKFYNNALVKYPVHYKDSTIKPMDSFVIDSMPITKKPVYQKGYKFYPEWSGYYLMSLSMTSSNGNCDDIFSLPIIAGFAMNLELPDSIVCQKEGTSLSAKTDFRMFHPDPVNFGTWDLYDYWRDPQRQLDIINGVKGREAFTKWDWSKADDDTADKQTIFGGGIYGATGVGSLANPFKQLGGGGPTAKYYKNDSGVYTMRVIGGDSTGCMDTITRRLFITRLDAGFKLNLSTPSCNSIIEFYDSSYLFDPCNWAIRNCQGSTPISCDFVKKWTIDWGDGTNTNVYERKTGSEQGLPPKIAHKYSRNGWFKITYRLETDQGCADTFERMIKIPGPRPKLEFTDKAGRETIICIGDSLRFNNISDSATDKATFIWFFGDGEFANDGSPMVTHTYDKAGDFYVFLQQYDSLILPPNIRKFCPAIYPDTPTQAAFIVHVLPRDTVRGSISKQAICPGDTITFTDNSDTLLKSYKWTFVNQGYGVKDSITVSTKTFTKDFSLPGTYQVFHTADYDPSRPQPWCPTDPVPFTFLVDSIEANFDIDSSNVPEFCFTRTDVNGVEFRWGFGHQNDITIGPLVDFIESTKAGDKKVCTSYDSSGVYWVCLIARNSTGCEDTICKQVQVNLFLFLANVFTPGTLDGKNDAYRVPIQGQDVFEIKIFNRWGERVFKSEDPRIQWNGQVNNNGAECPEGTYFYQLRYRFKGKDKVETISGSINLIR